jgi:hypothetical protein
VGVDRIAFVRPAIRSLTHTPPLWLLRFVIFHEFFVVTVVRQRKNHRYTNLPAPLAAFDVRSQPVETNCAVVFFFVLDYRWATFCVVHSLSFPGWVVTLSLSTSYLT